MGRNPFNWTKNFNSYTKSLSNQNLLNLTNRITEQSVYKYVKITKRIVLSILSSALVHPPFFFQVTNSHSRSSTDRFKRAVTSAYLTECLNKAFLSNPRYENENILLKDNHKILLTSAFFHHLQSSSCNAYQVSISKACYGDSFLRFYFRGTHITGKILIHQHPIIFF